MSLILTQAGLAALVEAEASGAKIQATHMAVGDGGGTTPEHTSASTGLVREMWRGPLQSIAVNPDGETEAGQQVVFEVHVPLSTGGWYIRECALYAGNTLLAIGPHPTLYKPAPADPTKVEHIIKAPITFGNAESVSLIVDPTVVLASQEHVTARVAAHNVAPDTHADLRALAAAAGAAAEAHATRTDNPHAVTAAQVGAAPQGHAHTIDDVSGLGQATATAQGLVELATTAEAQAGTDTSRAVTPAGLAAALAAGQRVRAWVAFDASGGVVTVLGSYNVSSVTRTAAGKFDITFQTAMPDANYAAVQACRSDASSANRVMTKVVSVSAGVFSGAWGGDDSDGTWFDQPYNSLVVVQ